MFARLIRFSIQNRFLVFVLTALLGTPGSTRVFKVGMAGRKGQ